MNALTLAAGLLATVIAASPLAAMPAPADRFAESTAAEIRQGQRSPDAVAGCFARTARHPSFANFARYGDTHLYRLRIEGLMFESIRLAPAPEGGTIAEIRLADSSRQGRARFEELRGRALAACLQAPMQVAGL